MSESGDNIGIVWRKRKQCEFEYKDVIHCTNTASHTPDCPCVVLYIYINYSPFPEFTWLLSFFRSIHMQNILGHNANKYGGRLVSKITHTQTYIWVHTFLFGYPVLIWVHTLFNPQCPCEARVTVLRL